MNATPIENRALWKTHHAAMDSAKAQGADFHCATMAGFAATDTPRTQERDEKETTMKCWTHCGRTLDELDNYCPACGEKRPPDITENAPIDVDALVDEWTRTPFPKGSKTWVEEQNAGLRQLAAMAAERAQCATIDELDRLRACEVALLRLREIYATSMGSDGCGTIGGDLCAEWNALLEGGAANPARAVVAHLGAQLGANLGAQPATPKQVDPPKRVDESRTGIYSKYQVFRSDGSSGPGGKHEHCEYYVLDWNHDRFAVPAARAYADACAREYPELARDLRATANEHAAKWEPQPATPEADEVAKLRADLAMWKGCAMDADGRGRKMARDLADAKLSAKNWQASYDKACCERDELRKRAENAEQERVQPSGAKT